MTKLYDFAIVGGGIVGLSTGMALARRFPHAAILVLEKEASWATHQTGHNSGVIHSGIYYKPGSFKAKFARDGNLSMTRFCEEHGIEHDICGKVIVATTQDELVLMDQLFERGRQNQLDIEKIGPERLREIEPHVAGLGAIRVPSAGIVDYKAVCRTFAQLIAEAGGELKLGQEVRRIVRHKDRIELVTQDASYGARFLINCAGLFCDRVARMDDADPQLKIVPFRGEYYEIKPERRHLVKHLIYPVPNPAFPFLGVHYTRMISGHIEAGPNAVLAFKREGYRKRDVSLRDLAEVLAYPGFWKLSSKYWREGLEEMVRSASKAAFVKSLQQLIPDIRADDLVPAPAGVRAQALRPDGGLVDDFHIIEGDRSIHVCNAPSPAATASIEIGRHIAARAPAPRH